jgi:hypothetical protein
LLPITESRISVMRSVIVLTLHNLNEMIER